MLLRELPMLPADVDYSIADSLRELCLSADAAGPGHMRTTYAAISEALEEWMRVEYRKAASAQPERDAEIFLQYCYDCGDLPSRVMNRERDAREERASWAEDA